MQPATPTEEYKKDAQGRLVPIAMIRPIDLARDNLVQEIVAKATAVSAEQYSVKIGGEKGNVSLVSYDGRYKVQRAIQETLVFDERLQAAKALIDACLQRWSEGAQPEIKVLINDAFQVDKSGNINTGRVLGLRRLDIQDDEWQRAMKAIGEALQVAGSKSYVRVYERIGTSSKYRPISLDMAGE